MSQSGSGDTPQQLLGSQAAMIAEVAANAVVGAHKEGVRSQGVQSSLREDAYGHSFKNVRHEHLHRALTSMDGIRSVSDWTEGAQYPVAMVEETGVLILPMRATSRDAALGHAACRIPAKSNMARVLRAPGGLALGEEPLFEFGQLTSRGGGRRAKRRALLLWVNSSYRGIFELGIGEVSARPSATADGLMDLAWSSWMDLMPYVAVTKAAERALHVLADPDVEDEVRFDDDEDDLNFGLRLRRVEEQFPSSEEEIAGDDVHERDE